MRPLLRASSLACLALLVTGGSAFAGGEVTRATLSWVRLPGAEACIAAPALAAAVERRLGHPVFSPAPAATLSVEGWVEPAQRPLRWRAIVTVADASGKVLGSREILTAATDCNDVVGPLALGLALMIDPEAPKTPGDDPPGATIVVPDRDPEGPSPAAPRPEPPPAPPPAPPPPGGRLQMTLGPLLGVGAMPGTGADMVSPGGLLRLVFGPPTRWGVEIQGTFHPAHDVPGATFHRAHLAVLGCPVRRIPVVRIEICAGLAAGAVGRTRDSRSPVIRPVIDGLVELRAGHRPFGSPLFLSLGITLGVPFLPWSFDVDEPVGAATVSEDTSQLTIADGGGKTYWQTPVYGVADLAVGFEIP